MDKQESASETTSTTTTGKSGGVKLETTTATTTGGSGAEDDAMSSSSGSGGEEDDEAESERRRAACLADMRELESLFARLKEALIKEKQCLVETKMREIEDETVEEFTSAVAKMQQNMEMRLRLANLLREYKLQNAQHLIEYEKMSMQQSLVNDKTALFDRHVAKIESEIIQLEERRRQLNLDYSIYQLMQSEKNNSNEDRSGNEEQQSHTSAGEQQQHQAGEQDENTTPMEDASQHQQPTAQAAAPQLRKSTRNKGASIESSAKTSASSSGIWSGGNISADLCSGLEVIRNQALGQLYARQLDPDAAPYIVYSLSDLEILEDLSIIKMNNSLNSRLNRKV